MSTNKTPNYQLHSWTPEDEFHLSEINENFEKLDAAAAQAMARPVVGQYTTLKDDPVHISLGFRPRVVMLDNSSGSYTIGAMITDVLTLSFNIDNSRRLISAGSINIPLTDDGFTVPANGGYNNSTGTTIKYMAFR